MALTTRFLEDLGIDKETASKIFAEYSKTIQPKLTELQTAKQQIAELSAQLENAPNTEIVAQLEQTIAALEQKEIDREAAMQKESENTAIETELETAVGKREFVNEFTKESVFAAVKAELAKEENSGKTASEIFELIVKDKTNIFVNTRQAIKMPTQQATLATGDATSVLQAKYANNPFFQG